MTSSACKDELRAPVSTLALTAATPNSGTDTHSRQPKRGLAGLILVVRGARSLSALAVDFFTGFSGLIALSPVHDGQRNVHAFGKVAALEALYRGFSMFLGPLRNQVGHRLQLSKTQESITRLEQLHHAGVGVHLAVTVQRQHVDVSLFETAGVNGLTDQLRALWDHDIGHVVASADGQALANVHFGEFDLRAQVADDSACHIQPGGALDA